MCLKQDNNTRYTEALIRFLMMKDSEIRISILKQGRDAVDMGLHAGGAMSAVIPLVALYYGGCMNIDVEHPTASQDVFVLSKGHAVAAMASIWADLGYIHKDLLQNSRSRKSILNGHPGPLLPGVHVATGPMGQGICVAGGFALAGRDENSLDVFVLTGDGELQEGTVWEAIMYAGAVGLDNLCVIVDRNYGQLDDSHRNVFPMKDPGPQLESFGFNVVHAEARRYEDMMEALGNFKYRPRRGKPTAIIAESEKGYGSFSSDFIKHKLTVNPEMIEKEIAFHEKRRAKRTAAFHEVEKNDTSIMKPLLGTSGVRYERAPIRDKKIIYSAGKLPRLEADKQYQASGIITSVIKEAAGDPRVVTIDADLGSTSGLFGGVASIDRTRALNVGIAEANMMCIGEAYAVLGYNVWVSTFCPFFNWNVLRRIAIGQQERIESISSQDGWLNEGHTLDMTFLATAANFDTQTNGATHMGNDDMLVFRETGGLKIIDVSCPLQLMDIMRWILEGNRGLVYLRIMRAPSGILYDDSFRFEYRRAYSINPVEHPQAVIVSSGRGVHEAVKARDLLQERGISIEVIDMPSIDNDAIIRLAGRTVPVIFAEQNNGYIWTSASRLFLEEGAFPVKGAMKAVNTSTKEGSPRYIHSGTYEELLDQFSLKAEQLAGKVLRLIGKTQKRPAGL